MSDLDLDPEKAREMARTVRGRGDAVSGLEPLAAGLVAAPTLEGSEIGTTVDAIAAALDKVVDYHARGLRAFADLADATVAEFVSQDQAFAANLREAGQR